MGLLWLLLFGLMQILNAKILLMPDFPQGFIVKCSKDGKLLRSDSFGLSWKEVTPLVEQSPFVTSIASDSKGERLIAATKSAGVFLSSDSGMSWRQLNLPTDLSWTAVASNQLGKRMIVTSVEGSVFLSGDGGDSWQEAASVAPQRNSWTSAVSDRSGQYLALTSSNDGIYVSFDFGANWVKTDTPSPPRRWCDVTTDFSGQFLAAIAEDDSETIYHSEDYGLTWRAVAVGGTGLGQGAWRSVASDHSGAFLSALTSDGVLYTSSTYGNEWRAVTSLPLTQRLSDTSFDEAQGVHLLALSDDNSGAFSSRDGGVTWQMHFSSLHTSSEEQSATSSEAFKSLFSGYQQGFFPQKVRQQLHALQEPPVENKVEASRANFDHLYNQFQDFLFSADVGSFDQEITGAPTYEPSAVPSPPPSPSPSKQPTPLPTAMPSAPFLDLTATSASRNYAVRNAYAFAAVDAQQGLWFWGGSQLAVNETMHLLLDAKEVVSSLYAYVIVLQSGEFLALGARTAIDGWFSYSSFKVVKVCASESAFAAITEEGGVIAFGSVGHGGVVSESLLPYLQSGVRGLVATAGAFCAWTSDGRVFCWGNRHTGGDVSSLSNDALRDVVQVLATRGAFAALTTSGDVITWGDCLRGGCQQGLTDVISIIAASSAFVALGGDYEVVAWGNPRYGGDLPTATKAAIGTSAAAIFHNVGAIAVLLSSGRVVTWGDAGYGGNSSAVSSLLVDVVNVTSTDRAFAALDRSGRVIVWGDGQFGGQIPSMLSAVTSEGVRSVVGSKAAFAAITASGEVVTWGDALFGADTSSVSSFIGQGVAAVQGNSGGFLAVNASGAVFMWGNKAVFEEEGLISHVTALPLQFFS